MSTLSDRSTVPVARTGHRRRGLALVAVILLAVSASACLPPQEQSFLDRTNSLRASQGLRPYKEHATLTRKAESWAQHMAATRVLSHSTLSAGLSGLAWRALGENVGVASGRDPWLQVHNMFVASSAHRANLVSTRFTHMGIGVATSSDGRVWVVEVFAQL